VGDYVEAFLPTCGFSVEEAKLAWRVTIIGNEQGVSAADAQDLLAAGCQVERIVGNSGEETRQMLLQLARNRQHSGAD
jgi:putative cell wall-binding protein